LLKSGNADKAVDELRQVVKVRPEDAIMRQNLALVLYQAGRNEEAIVEYGTALELDPNNAMLQCYLGMALQKAGKYRDAIMSYESAQHLNPKSIDIYKHLADIYALANEREKSIVALKQGLELARATGDKKNVREFSAQLNH
jgi:protein O-GlcNAc transferase